MISLIRCLVPDSYILTIPLLSEEFGKQKRSVLQILMSATSASMAESRWFRHAGQRTPQDRDAGVDRFQPSLRVLQSYRKSYIVLHTSFASPRESCFFALLGTARKTERVQE